MLEGYRTTHHNLLKLFQFALVVEATYLFFLDWSLLIFFYHILVAATLGRGLSDPHDFRHEAIPLPSNFIVRQRMAKAVGLVLLPVFTHCLVFDFPLIAPKIDSSTNNNNLIESSQLFTKHSVSLYERLSSSSVVPLTFGVDRVGLIWVLSVDFIICVLAFCMLSVDCSDHAFSLTSSSKVVLPKISLFSKLNSNSNTNTNSPKQKQTVTVTGRSATSSYFSEGSSFSDTSGSDAYDE